MANTIEQINSAAQANPNIEHQDGAAANTDMAQGATPDVGSQTSGMQTNVLEQEMAHDATEASSQSGAQVTEQASDLVSGQAQATEQAAGQVLEQGATQATETVGQVAGELANQAATAPLPMESAFTWGGYFQAIGTLLILLALLWGVVWLVRRYGRFNFLPKPGAFPRDGLRLESQLPLGPRKGLMVVRFLNKRLLIGVTDHQITLLKETTDDEDENNMEFKDVMEMAQRQKSDD